MPNEFGNHLQQLRLKAGLSQSQLATAAGIPVKTIQNWEIGRGQPRLTALPKLASTLGVTLDELIVPPDEGTTKRPRGRPKKG